GAKMAVLLGGIIIALGQFSLTLGSEMTFYGGLVLIAIGTGLLKPNISAMVGALYTPEDRRRDSGFSIFYMGINVGAWLAPFACGFFAQSETFKAFLRSSNIAPSTCWRWAFAVAGFGMVLGVIQYLFGQKYLATVGHKPHKKGEVNPSAQPGDDRPITGEDYQRLGAVVIFCFFAAMFWAVFEQAGSSLTLFADKMTHNVILGVSFPSSFYQSVNPSFIVLLTPVFAWLWIKWGDKQPSTPMKFSIGLLFAGLGFLVAALATNVAGGGQVSAWWLIGVYFIHTVGELCLSPVGLSTMTKLAHPRLVGMVMGFWFLGPWAGNLAGGLIAGHFDSSDASAVIGLFLKVGMSAVVGAIIMAALSPIIRKLMVGVK
ncbi:MAG TPA: peptide MFS transporter, partial [Acidobacteriota bacterium]|nr:peptide MFS transporter [Acidobacteriota bacterium]